MTAKKREANRAWRKANPGKCAAWAKLWRERNRDLVRKRSAEYARNHKDQVTATALAWAKANPERIREHKQVYYARKRVEELQRRMDALTAALKKANAQFPWLKGAEYHA